MEQLKKKVRIVPMTNEYLNDVAELERECFSNPWSRNMLAEELENACSAFLVALDAENGSVVGYAGLLAVVDEGCITKMAVRPDCRRGGVAGQLLDVFIRFAEGSRLSFLTLEVRESNYAAIALYGSRGFRGEGRRKNYYDHPKEDAIIMTKEFGAAEAEAQQRKFSLLNPPATRPPLPLSKTVAKCSPTPSRRRQTCTRSTAALCRRSPRASTSRPSPR